MHINIYVDLVFPLRSTGSVSGGPQNHQSNIKLSPLIQVHLNQFGEEVRVC